MLAARREHPSRQEPAPTSRLGDPPGAPVAFAEQLARELHRGGWQRPALAALEAGRPLALIVAQALWIARPAFDLLWPGAGLARLAGLLESPAELDRLIDALEAPPDA